MKVVLLAPLPPPAGGIAGWTQRMTEVKLKRNWEVKVVDEKVIGGRSVFGAKSKRSLMIELKRCFSIWTNLIKSFDDKEVKIVQSCIPAGITSMLREIICALISKLYKKKFIIHFRCTLPNMVKSKAAFIVFRTLLKLSDCVFVLNSASASFVKQNNRNIECIVIPNFIEKQSIKQRTIHNKCIKTLIYVGGVIPEKGCDLISLLANHFKDKEFWLIGNVGMKKTCFPDNVKIMGERSKEYIQNALDRSDVFLFLSRFSGEGFSNALAEAMARSLPCIVSDWAANRDMIENKGGIVLKEYSTKEAIKAIELLENIENRKKCGNWNYNKVLSSYTDSIVTSKYVDVYELLLK